MHAIARCVLFQFCGSWKHRKNLRPREVHAILYLSHSQRRGVSVHEPRMGPAYRFIVTQSLHARENQCLFDCATG